MLRQHKRVPEGNIPGQIRLEGGDMVFSDSLLQQIALKEDAEQIGLSAKSD